MSKNGERRRELVASAPPLTPKQRDLIAAVFAGVSLSDFVAEEPEEPEKA
jgi:hypothetical protein